MATLPPIVGKISFTDDGATATLGKVSTAATQTATATKAVGDQAKAAAPNVGQFGSTVGLAGQTIGRFNTGLGQTVTAGAAALGSIQAMTTAGLGPLGLAFGVASTAIAFFTTQQAAAEAKTKAFTAALDDNARSLDSIIAKMREEQGLRQDRSRLAAGGGTAEEYEGEARRLEAEYRLMRDQLGADSALFRAAGSRLEEQIARARQMAAAVDAGGGLVETTIEDSALLLPGSPEFEAERARRSGGRRRGGGGRGGPSRPTLDELMQGRGGGGAADGLEGLDIASLGNDPFAQAAGQDKGADVEQERYEEQLDRNLAFLEKREAQEEESAERLKAINDSVFSAIEAGLQSSVDAWLSGSATAGEAAMQMVKGVAKALTTEAIIQGLKETALGIGALAVGNIPSSTGHFTAAATWAAVGTAAGAVGAVSGAFGAQTPAPSSSPQAGPALEGGSRERGGDVYNINWGSAGLVYAADRAQLGRDLQDAIEAGRSRLDRAA